MVSRPTFSHNLNAFQPSNKVRYNENMRETLEDLKKRLNAGSQYLQNNDMKVTELKEGYAKVEMITNEQILNIHGFVHGGALFSLADMAAGSASFTRGKDSVTLNASINYLKPGKGGKLIGIARQIRAGKTIGVYEVIIYNEKEEQLCLATFTMFFLTKNQNE